MSLRAGDRLGPYEILDPLGAGGMGEVYKARDTRLGREVAIKVLPETLSSDTERLRRFEREARAASSLNHPNIVTIYDIGQEGPVSYLAMELVEGLTLREILSTGGLPTPRLIAIAVQMADGLARAHASGIVHRDLKPENVMVTSDGLAKLLDFGLAKVAEPTEASGSLAPTLTGETVPGVVMGTVGYMSPEQATGRPLDFRSDQFSFGAILYEMATGRRAFQRGTAVETLAAILRDEPPPLTSVNSEAPEPFRWVIERCLAKEPERRYASTRDLAQDLRQLPKHTSRPLSAAAPARVGRPRAVLWGGTILALAAVLAVALLRRSTGPVDSLAVLPFVNASADPNAEFLSDGITESLINSVAQLPGLRVISRASAFHYKGKEADPKAVGRELGVRAVLSGRVALRGGDLEIGVELVDARDGIRLWGDHYNRKFADILALQGEITREIVSGLRLKLSGAERQRLERPTSGSAEAYELYLKGMFHWNRGTEEELEKALSYFRRAIEADPQYAPAYAGLSAYYGFEAANFRRPRDFFPEAIAAAEKAIELDETFSDGHLSLAACKLMYEWDWPAAEKEIERALELKPSSALALDMRAYYLIAMGRPAEAVSAMKQAQQFDPLSALMAADLAVAYLYAGQYDRCLESCRKSSDLDPGFPYAYFTMGYVLAQEKRFDEAIAAFEKGAAAAGGSPYFVSGVGYAYAVAGRRPEAEKILDRLEQFSHERWVNPMDVATIYIGLGERERAFEWLEKASRERSTWLIYLNVDRFWDPIRSDPRFADLVRRVGLPVRPK